MSKVQLSAVPISEVPGFSAWARRTVRGISWTYAALAGSRVVAFASMMVLARILLPSAFGQLGFALLFISYLDALGDLGMGSALIYYQKRSEEAAQVAFRINLISGAVWWLVIWALAPGIADFFRDPMVVPLLRSLAWIFPITALGNTQDALLRRNLSFGLRLIPDYARSLLKAAFSVALALQGFGIWSLVWGQLAGAAAWTLTLWMSSGWHPAFRAPMKLALPMLRYGWHIASVNILSTLVHHLDLLVVGRILGSAALGFYTLASKIPEVSITMLIWAVDIVAFPSYAKLQDDPASLRQAFRSTLRYISIVTLPIGLGLAFTATLLVSLVYGSSWSPAAPVVAALSLAAVARSLGSHAGNLFKAMGRPDLLSKIAVIRALILAPLLLYGTRYGITGVAIAQAVVTGASTLATLILAVRVLGISFSSCGKELRPAVAGSVGMGLMMIAIQFISAHLPHTAILLMAAGAGASAYVGSIYLASPDTIRSIRVEIGSILSRSA